MKFEFGQLLASGLKLVAVLASEPTPKGEKFLELERAVVSVLETVDDLVAFLPFGFGEVIKGAIDHPMVDGLERQYIAGPVAELLVQVYKSLHKTGGDAAVVSFVSTLGNPPILPRRV
jgi:hypothetical protein